MAKNNVKSSAFMKSEDVVFLGNAGNRDSESRETASVMTDAQSLTRRSLSRLSTSNQRSLLVKPEGTKYQPIQPKISTPLPSVKVVTLSPKSSVQVIKPTKTATPLLPLVPVASPSLSLSANTQCDIDSEILVSRDSTSIQPQQNIVVHRKQNINRSNPPIRRAPRERIDLNPKGVECTFPLQKPDQTPNGQLVSNRTTSAVRPTIPSGLTITPLAGAVIQKTNNVIEKPVPAAEGEIIICSRCSAPTKYTDKCEFCQQPFAGASSRSLSNKVILKSAEVVAPTQTSSPSIMSTIAISNEAFYGNSLSKEPQAQCIRQNSGSKVLIVEAALPSTAQVHPPNPRGRPRGSRNRVPEPVCLTISSDDDEPMDESSPSSINEGPCVSNSSLLLRQQPPRVASAPLFQQRQQQIKPSLRNTDRTGKKCMGSFVLDGETNKMQSVAVPDAGEELEDEEMVDEEEEEELESHSEDLNSSTESTGGKEPIEMMSQSTHVIICRSIRIGSMKIHPRMDANNVHVFVNADGFSFEAPTVKNSAEMVHIAIEESDISRVYAHLGRCLPILFIVTHPPCAEKIRKQLGMVRGEALFYDPEETDVKQKYITLLIDSMSDELRNFLRNMFPKTSIVSEIDQKAANEILVKSTPNHVPGVKPSLPGVNQSQCQIQQVVIQTIPVSIANAPVPVKKILTYPPPPQTGGIEITSDDLGCLDEGEFLNDAIIDFYLKYLMNEKLSETDRARTHIFNSFFYPRLTQKPLTRGKGEESSISVKRHTQVRSWTKNIDIFAKDFIIIPINQNVHWFLAIICNPGQVPETSDMPVKSAAQKAGGENVSSTNDQESCGSPAGSQVSSPTSDSLQAKDIVSTKDQACNTDDQSGDESCAFNSCYFSEAESSFMDDPAPDAPDSSTHPDKQQPPNNKSTRKPQMVTPSDQPCILIFDSLPGPSRNRIINTLREYLEIEWRMRKQSHRAFNKFTVQGYSPNVPLQSNYSDCGIYVLQYVESFFETPLPYYANNVPELEDWFPKEKIANKRTEIRNLIFDLQKRQSSNSASSNNADRPNTRQNTENKPSTSSSLPSQSVVNTRLSSS